MIGFQRGINLIFSKKRRGIIWCFLHSVTKIFYLKRENLYNDYNF